MSYAQKQNKAKKTILICSCGTLCGVIQNLFCAHIGDEDGSLPFALVY